MTSTFLCTPPVPVSASAWRKQRVISSECTLSGKLFLYLVRRGEVRAGESRFGCTGSELSPPQPDLSRNLCSPTETSTPHTCVTIALIARYIAVCISAGHSWSQDSLDGDYSDGDYYYFGDLSQSFIHLQVKLIEQPKMVLKRPNSYPFSYKV